MNMALVGTPENGFKRILLSLLVLFAIDFTAESQKHMFQELFEVMSGRPLR